MADYIDYPIDTDPDELLQQWIDEIRVYWPNWEPNENSLAYRGAAALCRLIAEGRDVAALVPEEIFRTIGRSLYNIAAIESSPARADTTWVMIDDAGYGPIPANTLVSVLGQMFETDEDISVASGETTITGVGITAIEDGAASSNLGAGGTVVDVEEAIGFVASVTLEGATAFGVDAEDNTDYLNRLKEILSLYTDVPIHVEDLAKRARIRTTGVYRAVAVDMYDADTDDPDAEGHASVAGQDADGELLSADVKDALEEDLTGTKKRILNGTIHIIDPEYFFVDINWEGTALAFAETDDVRDAGDDQLTGKLAPNVWGSTPNAQRDWVNKKTVKINDIVAWLASSSSALATVDSVEIKIRAADGVTVIRAFDDTDAVLDAVVPLTRPGVITGVVSAP